MKNIYLLLLITPLLFSCTKIVEFNGEISEPKLVINSIINPDSAIKVSVSESRFFLDDAPIDNIENATVKLFEDEIFITSLAHLADGYYTSSDVMPIAGKSYTIEVDAPDFDEAHSEATIPNKIDIVSIDTLTTYYTDYAYPENFEVGVKITDPAEEKNYYRISCDIESWRYVESSQEYIYNINDAWLWSDDPVLTGGEGNNEIFDTGVYNEYNIFDDMFFNGGTYTVKMNIGTWHLMSDHEKCHYKIHIFLESLSEEYFKYLKSRTLHKANEDNLFTEPVPVFSNIENGIGIFAGYSHDHISLDHEGYIEIWYK